MIRRAMDHQTEGAIVNMASIADPNGMANLASYVAGKGQPMQD